MIYKWDECRNYKVIIYLYLVLIDLFFLGFMIIKIIKWYGEVWENLEAYNKND